MTPILYYIPLSPPCQLVLLVAKHLNVKMELKEQHPLIHGVTDEYLKANPARTIPALDDNGFYLGESRAIAIYLLEQYGHNDQLIPDDPKEKALMFHRLFFDNELWRKVYDIVKPIIYFNKAPSTESHDRLNEWLEYLNTYLEGNVWLTGDRITLADYSALTTVAFIEVLQLADLEKFKNIKTWLSRAKTAVKGYNEIIASTSEKQLENYLEKCKNIKI